MEDLWRRIEGILDARAERSDAWRERRGSLRPPVDAEEVARAEAELGLPLHPELRASLGVHDGQDPRALEVFKKWGLHSLAAALADWRFYGERHDYRREWLPIARDGGGGRILLDLRRGAVLWYSRIGNASPVAASLREWLMQVTSALPPEDDEEPEDEEA